ncbi:MAG: EAL domain-containing protein [Armatimonadetes bacterium]|nr:MAG: EAL domain-containing protein [Armatimonadota bacterium]
MLPVFLQTDGAGENSPLASLSQNALLASVNVEIDSDGRVRRYRRGFLRGLDQSFLPSLGALLADQAYGDTSSFLIDYGISVDRIPQISFADVYNNSYDPALVRGKVVLIGATATELRDEFVTPVSPSMSGVLVHALAYESLIQGRALVGINESIVVLFALVSLALMWPRAGELHLPRFAAKHAVFAGLLVATPFALQALAPVSLDVGAVLLAEAACFIAGIGQELGRRAREITRQREEHLAYVAYHDAETELPNRRALLEQLWADLAETSRHGGAVGVVAIGIDRFSTLRGAIGYGNANRIVRTLAAAIEAAPNAPRAYHLSTSILGVIVRGDGEPAARSASHQLLEVIDAPMDLDGASIDLALRTGSAFANADIGNAETLLGQATLALDKARDANVRNVSYDPNSVPDPKVQLALMSDMKAGLGRGEFTLLYQPKAAARDGRIVGAEALMRWRHPTQGMISPSLFIPVAEKTGAIDALTRWAYRRAMEDQAYLREQGHDLALAVNLSGHTLSDRDFCAELISTAEGGAARICLEITETAIIADSAAALAAIAAFKQAGIRISIDDYGAGLSSLAYLKQIPADELKLDKSLVEGAASSERDRLILKSTIDLAHGLGMLVVAEGVEDEATRAVLCGLGCDTIQGYLITHNESISIADYLTIEKDGEAVYRPTVHYAYHPCDDTILSLHEFQGHNLRHPESVRVMNDEIVDGMDDAVERAYQGWPDRIYIVDLKGNVWYRSAPGPAGFKPAEAEQSLRNLLKG